MNQHYLRRIRAMTPFDRFVYYMDERLAIRTRRMRGEARPWTNDPILNTYKFTNVRREWDYTSQWLITNWYQPHKNSRTLGFAAVLARFLCYVPTLQEIGYPELVDFARLEDALRRRQLRKEKLFTSAYLVVGGAAAGRAKYDWLVHDVLRPVWNSGLLTRKWTGSILEFHDALKRHSGFGDFMTQECVLDLQWTHVLRDQPAFDKKMYGYAGPGAIRGLRWIDGVQVRGKGAPKYKPAHARQRMIDLWSQCRNHEDLPSSFGKILTVHDIEFNLCEFDKYNRALTGQGKPKQLYKERSQLTLL